jgi:hypothetical protein
MSSIGSKPVVLFAMLLLAIAPTLALGQARQVREGVVLYWGLVPAAVVAEKHALEEMHGAVPRDGGQNHHLVIALFNADGKRIVDAVVQAQLHEVGIVDAPRKYLTPMVIDGQASYGQLFSTVKDGPYQFLSNCPTVPPTSSLRCRPGRRTVRRADDGVAAPLSFTWSQGRSS